jgi:hypothetical protein
MQGLGFGKSRELLLSLAVGKDRRYKVLCLGIMELVLIAAVYYAANWNLIKESTGVAGRLSLRHRLLSFPVVVCVVVVEKRSRRSSLSRWELRSKTQLYRHRWLVKSRLKKSSTLPSKQFAQCQDLV